MKKVLIHSTSIGILVLALTITAVQAQSPANPNQSQPATSCGGSLNTLLAQARRAPRSRFGLLPAGSVEGGSGAPFRLLRPASDPGSPVAGVGTLGHLTRWARFTSGRSFIGDSSIFEDLNGLVGIGTETPASKLTVAGMIETTLGGIKFPDGSIQTTAGLASVFHDASLLGNGASPTLLGIAPGGVQTIHLANAAVTGAQIANGAVVRSLNSLTENVTLAPGNNITITPSGNTLTIGSPNALAAISHDVTLTGSGTSATPLGVAVPLSLTGSIPGDSVHGNGNFILNVQNNGDSGSGVHSVGGNSTISIGGHGVETVGGDSTISVGGNGVETVGGNSTISIGGHGVHSVGGNSTIHIGGDGTLTVGGSSTSSIGGSGVVAISGLGPTNGLAGEFDGDVRVFGNLAKAGGSFEIDHPLDPENKYLYHSFVESPDMMNIYNGNIRLDANGEAVVELPDWFGALNKDFRYLLTAIGAPSPTLYIAEEIANNRFKVAGGTPGMKVSWQVTGIRQDAWANAHRIPVEEEKADAERGHYLHPELFNQPEEKSVEWARRPELMQQLKQRRQEFEQRTKQQ